MFEGIGRMGDYLKQRDLKLQAKYKMKTGQSLDALKEQLRKNNTFEARTIRAQKTQMTDDTKVAIIRQKLHAGRELSAAELSYLKKNDPDLYSKAREAQETRTELQQALKRAKTKAEAIRAVAQIQAKVATAAALEAKYGSASGAMASAAAGTGASASGISADGAAAGVADTASSAASFDTDATGQEASASAGNLAATNGALPGAQAAHSGATEAAGTGSSGPAGTSEQGAAAAGTNGADPSGTAEPAASGKTPATGADGKDATDSAAKEAAAKEQTLADAVELANTKKALMETYLSSDKSAALPLEKYIFMLAAINDEWAKFANSKDYEELPDDYLSMDKEETRSTKKPYRPKGMANVEAAERYKTADSLLSDDTTGGLLDLMSQLG